LRDRINRRVVQMIADGLVEEVRGLQEGPNPLGPVPAQAVGYREVIDMLEGRATLPETIERIQGRTRQFAKRQMTWFRGLAEVELWPLAADEPAVVTADRLVDRIKGAN
jgi:tRNA dimethylallyltransferase